MGDDEKKRAHFLYGSAGMAASGMMPGIRLRRQSEEEKEQTSPQHEDREEHVSESPSSPPEENEEHLSDTKPGDDETAESGALPLAPIPHLGSEDVEAAPSPEAFSPDEPETFPFPSPPPEPSQDLESFEVDDEQEESRDADPIPLADELSMEGVTFGEQDPLDSPEKETPGESIEPETETSSPEGLRAILFGTLGMESPESLFEGIEGIGGASVAEKDAPFREVLDGRDTDLVLIAEQDTRDRYPMIRTSLEAGAHVLCAPPLTRSLRETDELLLLASERNLTLSPIHPFRNDPHLLRFHAEHREIIGDLLEIRLFGELHPAAGGEDLLVSGCHLFDLARLFAGDPEYCTATITERGAAVIGEDAHESESGCFGRVLGDAVRADFRMESGIHVTFLTDPRFRESVGPAGAEFIGAKGRMRLLASELPRLSLLTNTDPSAHSRKDVWQIWPATGGPYHPPIDGRTGPEAALRQVARNWVDSIMERETPLATGEDALKALEMVHGVWQAAVTTRRSYFPLVQRIHALSDEAI